MGESETWTKDFPTVRIRERHWIRNGEQLTILQVNPSGRHEVIGSNTKYLASEFNGWEFLGPLSPADAEQLHELRQVAQTALDLLGPISDDIQQDPKPRNELLAISESAGDGSTWNHALVDSGNLLKVVQRLRAVLNPKQPEKETQR